MTASLKDMFVNGQAKIAYREWSDRGGEIIAYFRNDHWCYRHESDPKSATQFDAMSPARARYIFPSDARIVA